jgi:6-pyruvoyl-tetrahydropterin synthase related domain
VSEPLPSNRTPRWRPRLRTAVDVVAILCATAFIASFFPARLMFSDTTTNGGDISSHVYAAAYLREVLLPAGRIVGWCPGNYAGFPIFQFYFPLPFLAIAALSLLIPLAVAFKIVSVLGVFALPLACYLALRFSRVPFPGPALGAILSLAFLFMEANSMWGGNIPSTLAGEFTFSWAVAIFVLFLGTLRYTVATGRGVIWNGVLVALGGVCHGYALLWAGLASLSEFFNDRRWGRTLLILLVVHGLAIVLMAFWLVPLLAYSPWTTGFAHVWMIQSVKEILPPVLWPAAVLAVATTGLLVIQAVRGRGAFPAALGKLWAGALIGLGMYFAGRALHVVDIRFLPFFQLGVCLIAAAGLGYTLARLLAPEVWPAVALLALLPWVHARVEFIPSWIGWNYSGFERKPTWPRLKAISDHLRGDFRQPRVVFEHSDDHEAFGTTRVFENLPLFSGRSTLEGLYMQASPSAPFVFYVQSEISKQQSCPFDHFGCSRFDFPRGVDHLRMFNVSHLIAKSAETKAAAGAHPGLLREATFGDYEIFRLLENDPRHAIPLQSQPFLVIGGEWKDRAYRWFKQASPGDAVPVFAASVDEQERRLFAGVVDEPSDKRTSAPLVEPPTLVERLESDRIVIEGARPGHPILIRISYHPRWTALTGEKIWLAGPSFMLVFPKSERVELAFGDGPPVIAGRYVSILGVLVLLVAIAGRLKPGMIDWLAKLRPTIALRAFAGLELSVRRHVRLVAAIACAGGVLFVVGGFVARASDADTQYRRGQVVYDDAQRPEAERLAASLPYFLKAQRLAPLSGTAINAAYYQSVILFRLERWAAAEASFQSLLDRFPEAQAAAESQYHVGICRARLQREDAAIAAWRETERRYPDSVWAKYARDRLTEHGQR